MKQCEFCGTTLVDEANFCGKCGRVPSQLSQSATGIGDLSTVSVGNPSESGDDGPTTLSGTGKHPVLHPITLIPGEPFDPDEDSPTLLSASNKHEAMRTPSGVLHPVTLVPISDDDEKGAEEIEDEDTRKRAAILSMGLLPLAEIASAPTLSQTPVVQGTPPLSQAPVLANTPQVAHVPTAPGTPSLGPGSAAGPSYSPSLPHTQPPQPLPPPSSVKPIQPPTGSSGQPSSGSPDSGQTPGHSPGCLALGAIFMAALLVILSASVGLGLTVFAPGLSLSGNSVVTPGSNLLLHGHNFLPNSSVTLTLDGSRPLYFSQRQPSTQLVSTGLVLNSLLSPSAHNVIATHGDGTFSVTIQVDPTWVPGHHTIQASEGTSHRSASLSFTIVQNNIPTPTPTIPVPTPTPPPSPTPTPTPSPNPTPTPIPVQPPTLSCASPTNISLGPIGELTSQTASSAVTLCTAGTGTLTWRASWNQNQAPWLKLGQTSGFIQAPGQVRIALSASAAKLTAGTYHVTVTFVGLESNTARSVNITLTVKAGCVSATPQGLRFAGVEGTSDPDGPQTITVTNCALTGNWSAAIANGSNWLTLSASKGTLNGGASTTVSVTASNLKAGLKAGTYQDSITFTIGSDRATVSVTLIVSAPPTIEASPVNINADTSPCTSDDRGNSDCTITLTNTSRAVALTWSSSSGGSGVSVQADTTTIPAGSSEQITIVIPVNNCGTPIRITFTAPGNTASITWNCTPSTIE